MGEKLLSICFINYNDLDKLKISIKNLLDIIDNLDNEFSKCIEIIVSDNKSNNFDVVKEYFSQLNEVKLISTEANTGVDGNIRNCFEFASGDYCWIFAADDYICSKIHLVKLIDTLKDKQPDMLSFNISLHTEKTKIFSDVEVAKSIKENINFLIHSGKISTCIYRRYDCYEECIKIANKFSGMGYYHLSYGAGLNVLGHSTHMFINDFYVYTLHSNENHRHEYHPKFSQNAHRSIATEYFVKNSIRLRLIKNHHLFFQLIFVFKIYKNKNYLHWEPDLLFEYIYDIGLSARNSKNIFYIIFYIIIIIRLVFSKDSLGLLKLFSGFDKKVN